jgi:hypothetical protein
MARSLYKGIAGRQPGAKGLAGRLRAHASGRPWRPVLRLRGRPLRPARDVPARHTRDEVKAALAVVAAMDQRQRAQLADAVDGAPLRPQHRAVLFRLLGPTPAGWR